MTSAAFGSGFLSGCNDNDILRYAFVNSAFVTLLSTPNAE